MTHTHLGGTAHTHPGVLQPELVPASQLTPHPNNPRRGDTTTIAASLGAHGLYRQIIAQRSTGHILAGNHTFAALTSRGAEKVPVVWLDVDDAEALRIMADDNRTSDLGTYDDAALLDLLTSLGDDLPVSYDGDETFISLLQRRVEAEDVFTVGADHLLDEFRTISGQDPTGYAPEYARKTVVYLRDAGAVDDFCARLGIPAGTLGRDLNYPLGWTPNDRRKRRPDEHPDADD